MGSELHGYGFAVGFGGLEELASLEAEHAGENVGGEHLDPGIQIPHDSVVIAAGILDGILSLAERALQLSELLGGFQFGIIFGDREQALERASQLIFRYRFALRCGGLHGLRAELGNVFEGAFFVSGVAFDGFDKVGNQVMATPLTKKAPSKTLP